MFHDISAQKGFEDRPCKPPPGIRADQLSAWVDRWFPPAWIGVEPDEVREVRAACQRCPIQAACLRHANEERIPFGIYGGVSAEQRKQSRRARSRIRLSERTA